MFLLGSRYEDGKGAPLKDIEKARFWYKRAADLGEPNSKNALIRMGL